jgi:hypothetical protein
MRCCRRLAQAETRAAVTCHDVTPIYGNCKEENEQKQEIHHTFTFGLIETYTVNYELVVRYKYTVIK